MDPGTLVAAQNVGLGIASFVFLTFIIVYILKRDDKRHDAQAAREEKRLEREDQREANDSKRLDAWQNIVSTQSTQIATLIQQLGSQSTQLANIVSTMIEMLQMTGRIEEFEKQNTVRLIQALTLLGERRKPDTDELKRMIDEGKR